ncbi:MAG: exonuclease domain-containing protein, partial [Bacteroidia bacterium]
MIFLSIDIETTGLDPAKDQILEFGCALVKDWKVVDTFRKTIWHERIEGNPFALAMNKELLQEISLCKANEINKGDIVTTDMLVFLFNDWINSFKISKQIIGRKTLTCAGKNFGSFDLQFCKKLPGWEDYFKINHRILDPSILYFDSKIDQELPSLEECKKRSGLFFDTT